MLQQISHIIYFLLGVILITILFLEGVFQDSSPQLGENITLLYTVLILPLLVYIYDSLGIHSKSIFTQDNLQRALICGGIVFLLYILGISPTILFFVSLLLLHIVFSLDSRVSFFLALVVFVYVIFYLLIGNSEGAEKLSIYAYYLLIIGVISEIVSNLVSPKIMKLGKK